LKARNYAITDYSASTGETHRLHTEGADCDGGWLYGDSQEDNVGCGFHENVRGCNSFNLPTFSCVDDSSEGNSCTRRVHGYSYFVCTPPKCLNGWDSNHGGSFIKGRLAHTWNPGLDVVATGPPGNEASGNCWGDMHSCGTHYPLGGDDNIWFEEVSAILWNGLVPDWFTANGACDSYLGADGSCLYDLAWAQALPPPVPGMGYYGLDADGFPDPNDPICTLYEDSQGTGGVCFSAIDGWACCDGHTCHCTLGDFPVCKGEEVWVAADLRLDGTSYAYRNFLGRDRTGSPYTGRGVPELADYSLTEDPDEWMHGCPCETWTGASTCGT
jgi:hypothetical protein